MAHDFNNLLTVSLGITDLIADQLPDDSPVRAQISQVISASRQAADLARQLLSVTGAGSRPHAPCDLNALIGGIEGLLRSALPPSVALDWRPCADAPWTEADQTQLRQVVLNLVKNAGEAIGPRSGRIAVATQRAQDAAGQRVAVVEVSDTGPGMDAATRARIFDPTFTTKLTGHGLGLAVVRSVVARHHGRISVESEPAAGTTFRIELPLLSDAAAAAEHMKEFTYEWVNVVILVAVLGYFARKPVAEFLATRRDTIAKNIASSEQLLKDAERRLAEWNEKAARLDADVQAILESTRKTADAEKAAIIADAEATASRIRQGAAGVVDRELRTARVALRKEAAELAVTLAGSLLQQHTSDADRNRLVDEFIAKIESTPGGTH